MTLLGVDDVSSRLASGLGTSALASAFTASTFGPSAFGASAFGGSAFGSSGATGPNMDGSDMEGSGVEGSDAVTGSLDVPAEWETPALREPDSPPIGSGCWSLTVNSPLKIDHLVTFISCQILTLPRTYRKFRKWPGGSGEKSPSRNAPGQPGDRFAAPAFPTNMA